MAWTSGNPVSIGDPTKKSHFDNVFDNGQFQRNTTTGAILTTLLATFGADVTVTSGNKMGIGIASADGTLHVHSASAGSITASAAGDDLVIENSDHMGISLFAPDTVTSAIYFGNPTDGATDGQIFYDHPTRAIRFVTAGTSALNLWSDSRVSSSTELDPDVDPGGLCLYHGANDGNVMTFKNSDVAHGMTAIAETDTYANFSKNNAPLGGLIIRSFSEEDDSLTINGNAASGDTTKSILAAAPVTIRAAKKSGTSTTGMGANENICVMQTAGTTRFIFDADGDSHQDVGTLWTNFDDEEDALAVRDLMGVLEKDKAKKHLFGMLKHNAQKFHDMGVITYTPKDKSPSGQDEMFLSSKGILGLYGGAIGELHGVMDLLISKLKGVGISTSYDALRKEFRGNQPALLT